MKYGDGTEISWALQKHFFKSWKIIQWSGIGILLASGRIVQISQLPGMGKSEAIIFHMEYTLVYDYYAYNIISLTSKASRPEAKNFGRLRLFMPRSEEVMMRTF